MNIQEGILAVDVGSGTQDILLWQPGMPVENCPRMVLPAATTIVARLIEKATRKGRHLFLSGQTMGGGPSSAAVRRHLQAGLRVFALREPALTLHDDLEKVKGLGIEIVENKPPAQPLSEIRMADIDLEAIGRALSAFHLEVPQKIAISVQDHGFSPRQSNRAFRFRQWNDLLHSGRKIEALLYNRPPAHLTRMLAVTKSLPGAWVMDTGACAVLGALLDPWVAAVKADGVTVVNVGNEHTVAALVREEKIWGVYEHHTKLLNANKFGRQLELFRRGKLSNREVFEDMGHGCRILPGADEASAFSALSVTGPNRERFSSLGGHMAAPFGDMMLTGCFGLVEALRRRLAAHEPKGN